jgi:hypothetical protein
MFVALGVLVPARPAFANTADDVIDTVEKASKAFEVYAQADPNTLTGPELAAKIEATAEEVRGYAADLERLADGAGDVGFGVRITELAMALDELADAWSALGAAAGAAIAAQPGDPALVAAANQVETAGDRMDKAAVDFDEYVKAHPIKTGDRRWFLWTGLLALAVLCLLVAIFIWIKSSHSPAQTTAVVAARKNLLAAGAFFVAGAAVTAVQYWKVEPGGTYQVFWYPMALGALWFLVGLPRYFAAASGAKQAAARPRPAPTSAPGMTDQWAAGVGSSWQGAAALSRPAPPPLNPNLVEEPPPLAPSSQQFQPLYPGQPQATPVFPGQPQTAPSFTSQPQATPVFPGQAQTTPSFPGQPQATPVFPCQPPAAPIFPGQPPAAAVFPGQPQVTPIFTGQPQAGGLFPGQAQAAAPYPGQPTQVPPYQGQPQAAPFYTGQPQATPPNPVQPQVPTFLPNQPN